MSDAEDAKKSQKNIVDVEKPEHTKPTSTSKPVIVGNRPLLKDPMVVDDESEAKGAQPQDAKDSASKPNQELSHAAAPTIEPSSPSIAPSAPSREEPGTPPEEDKETPKEDTGSPSEPETPEGDHPHKPATDAEKKLAAEKDKQTGHEAEIQQLIDGGQYILPINTIEKKQAKHFLVLGIVAAMVLVLIWIDIALDASLIRLGGLHPITHLFSN